MSSNCSDSTQFSRTDETPPLLTSDQRQAVLDSVEQTLARTRATREEAKATLERFENTLVEVKATTDRFHAFEKEMQSVLEQLLRGVVMPVEDVDLLQGQHGRPRTSSLCEAAAVLNSSRSVVFILGAGVSVVSGLFTYKDSAKTWVVDGQRRTHEEMATAEMLVSHPEEFWQYMQNSFIQMRECSPNAVHQSICDFVVHFKATGRHATVITQNIDGFERSILGRCDDLIELHGNIHEYRCSCSPAVYLREDTSLPHCPLCHKQARPNVLLFDEAYREHLHRSDTAAKRVKEAECLVVIGTQLKCVYPHKLVHEFARTGGPVIEVNIDPAVNYGNVLMIQDRCENAVPELLSAHK